MGIWRCRWQAVGIWRCKRQAVGVWGCKRQAVGIWRCRRQAVCVWHKTAKKIIVMILSRPFPVPFLVPAFLLSQVPGIIIGPSIWLALAANHFGKWLAVWQNRAENSQQLFLALVCMVEPPLRRPLIDVEVCSFRQ